MMPAQLLTEAIAVLPNTGAKALYLRDKCVPIEIRQILVHVILSVDAIAARNLSIYNKCVNVQATDVEVVDGKRTHASAPEC